MNTSRALAEPSGYFRSRLTDTCVAILVVGFPLITGCRNVEVPCSWAGQSVVVDGLSGDWPDSSTHYFPDEQIVLGLANDSSNLYMLFRFRDPKWAGAIAREGLTVYLDKQTKKKEDVGIHCAGLPSREQLLEIMPDSEGDDTERRWGNRIKPSGSEEKDQRKFVFFDKENILDVNIPTDGSKGPSIAFAVEGGMFTYEFGIPLYESVVRNYGLGIQGNQSLDIGVIWGGVPEGSHARPDSPSTGMGGRSGAKGGGMRGGGGRGGKGGGRSGQDGRPQMPEEQEVWIRTQLATQP